MRDTLNSSQYALKFEYDPVLKTLEYTLDSGFYSNVFQTFNALVFLLNHGIVPEKVKFSKSCYWYKPNPDQDIYPVFFTPNTDIKDLPLNKDLYIPFTNRIRDTLHYYSFSDYNKIIKRYFNPSNLVLKFQNQFIEKYNIDFNNTIVIYYRGTDKRREIFLASPEKYLLVANKILKSNPSYKVLVQTDQTSVKKYFKDQLKDNIITIDELLTTDETKVGCHPIIKGNSSIDETKHAVMLDAVIRCISKCKYVIGGSGAVNVAINLYRGTHNNMYRFDENGELLYNINGNFYRNGQMINCPP